MLPTHAAQEGLFVWLWCIGVSGIKTLKESLVLIAVHKIFHG